MRVVVTGASGNIGTALRERLAAGDVDVVGVARRVPPSAPDGTEWAAIDLAAPEAAHQLADVARGADAVVHLAWAFQPSHRPARLQAVGVGGSRAVIAAVRRTGVPHLVHMSSVGAYSPAPGRRVGEGWPTQGIPTLPYSRHKVAVERALDELEADTADDGRPPLVVTRLRPGFVLQRSAGSALARYGLPPWLPGAALQLVRAVPLDASLVFPVVHSEDVADAVVRVLEQRAGGAFNLAAEPPVTRDDLAAALDARPLHLPAPALHALLAATWRLRLQPLEPGWFDLAMSVPLLDTSRARQVLGWEPRHDALATLAEAVEGIADSAHGSTPAMRPRSLRDEASRLLRAGPPSWRERT